jgi:hypothetical protein
MRIKTLFIAVLATLSFASSAQSYIISQAYEIAVDDLRLPGNVVGSVSFKDCDTCEMQSVRVTTVSRYVVNNKDVALVDFKKAVNSIVDKESNIATVIHHLESNSIVAVHVVK